MLGLILESCSAYSLMDIRMISEPFLLYETVGMVSMYYSKSSFVKIAENLAAKYGDLLSPGQLELLGQNAMLADQFLYSACSDIDFESPDFKFFFKPFDTDRPNEDNCVARVAVLSFRKLSATGFDEQIEETKARWRYLKEVGVQVVDFTGGGISFALSRGKAVPTLFEQIYSLQYPHDAKMDAFRVLDNLDFYLDKLAALLRPYAQKLKEAMKLLRPIYDYAAQSWEQNFTTMTNSQLMDLIRVEHSHRLAKDAVAGISLFFFNEIGFGYQPGSDDEIATFYFGAGVYPEFTRGFTEKRGDALAEAMKAFTDPIKLEILSRLFRESDYCLNIAHQMDLNAGNVSRHLTSIYDCGFLLKERRNNRTYYNTDIDAVRRIFSDIESYIVTVKKPKK